MNEAKVGANVEPLVTVTKPTNETPEVDDTVDETRYMTDEMPDWRDGKKCEPVDSSGGCPDEPPYGLVVFPGRIVVRTAKGSECSKRIVIQGKHADKLLHGIVMALPPAMVRSFQRGPLEVGDEVLYEAGCGHTVQVDGESVVVLDIQHVIGVVMPKV